MPMRNFRSNLMAKIGVPSASVSETREKLENQILSERVTDTNKLSSFACKYELPADERIRCWRLLLDIDSCHRDASDHVMSSHVTSCMTLWHSLGVMHMRGEQPQPDNVLYMALMAKGRLKLNWQQQPAESKYQVFLKICEELLEILPPVQTTCDPDTDLPSTSINYGTLTDVLTITQAFSKKLTDFLRLHRAGLKEQFWTLLADYDDHLREQLATTLDSSALNVWLETGLVSLCCTDVIVRLWDKLIAGALCPLTFVMADFLVHIRSYLLEFDASNGGEDRLTADFVSHIIVEYVSIDEQVICFRKAIDKWHRSGSPLVPTKGKSSGPKSPMQPFY